MNKPEQQLQHMELKETQEDESRQQTGPLLFDTCSVLSAYIQIYN